VVDSLTAAFPQVVGSDFLQTLTGTSFYVYDQDVEPKRCFAHEDSTGTCHFTVYNSTGRPVHFLAIDKCLIMDSDGIEHCDFALFDAKTFCFVELKIVTSALQRGEANRKAKAQLKATILHFREKLTFSTKRIEAYVCVGTTAPRPARRASDLDEIFEFEEELGVALYHGNEKRFAS
jgi:hypothetical protein